MAKTIGIDPGRRTPVWPSSRAASPPSRTPRRRRHPSSRSRRGRLSARPRGASRSRTRNTTFDQALHGAQDEVSRDDDRPAQVEQGENGDAWSGRGRTPRPRSAMILQKLRADAEAFSASRSRTRSDRARVLQQRAARGDEGRKIAVSTSSAPSTSRPRPRWPTGSTRRAPTRPSSSSTWAADVRRLGARARRRRSR